MSLIDKVRAQVDRFFEQGVRSGRIHQPPTFLTDYQELYPELKIFEDNHAIILAECQNLLSSRQRLPNIDVLAGDYTQSELHYANWKVFAFRIGKNISENCKLAPQTAAILNKTPGIFTAFFSIIHPKQKLVPHWGYHKGFLRYHLGVIIPENNERKKCWLRINDNAADNEKRDKSLVTRGQKYYWHNGEGVMFDDTQLHDAANETDEIRVVLWLDVYRKMPLRYNIVNRLILGIARQTSFLARSRAKARLTAGS